MNKLQARMLISIAFTVVIVVPGTVVPVKMWGIHWGLLGFICSVFVAMMVVFVFNFISVFYDELGDKE